MRVDPISTGQINQPNRRKSHRGLPSPAPSDPLSQTGRSLLNDTTISSPRTHRTGTLIGALLAFMATFAFSVKAVLVKLAYVYPVDAVTLLTFRMLFSFPFFLAAAAWSARNNGEVRLQKRDWVTLGILGFLGFYLASLLDFIGLTYISASLERLIVFLYPTLVILLGALFLRKRITPPVIAALVLSYVGIFLVFVKDLTMDQPHLLIGSGLVFGSTLAYAAYLIGCEGMITRLGPVRFTAYAMTLSCIMAGIHFLMIHPAADLIGQPRSVYELSLVMAIFSTVLPAFMLSAGIRKIGAAKASIIGSTGPVSTIVIAYFVLGESMAGNQIIGAALVLVGVVWISVRR